MTEIRDHMYCVLEDYACDKCREGFMRPTGRIMKIKHKNYKKMYKQKWYRHKCNYCGNVDWYEWQYPRTILVPPIDIEDRLEIERQKEREYNQIDIS